jgi:hypothetical protein
MIALGLATAAILLALAALHAVWGFGIWWPIADEAGLARTIAGFRRIQRMPSGAASFAVAAALAVSALIAVLLADGVRIGGLVFIGGAGCALVFLGRGIAGYMPAWASLTPEEPFRTYDRTYYSPLCLAIGFAFLVLLGNLAS